MKKDFESRFKPNVMFYVPDDMLDSWNKLCRERFATYDLATSNKFGAIDNLGNNIYFSTNSYAEWLKLSLNTVSIYEAIPELIPEGMRYNKELGKLVPDVIEDKKNISNEYASEIDLKTENEYYSSTEEFYSKQDGEKILNKILENNNLYNNLQDILESSMKYGDKIRAIRNTDIPPKHTGGDGNKWYDLPVCAIQLQDLIEHKNMNGNIKDIFKACYRVGEKDGVEEIYDVEKMAYYSLRELGRVLNTKDYIALAIKLMGKQNIKEAVKNAK